MAARRVLFKISGKSLDTNRPGEPINFDTIEQVAKGVLMAIEKGVQVAIMPGGGNILRGGTAKRMSNRDRADQAGMTATLVNALVLEDALESVGLEPRLHSSVAIPEFAASFSRQKARSQLDKGLVVIVACGMGESRFTTDTAAVLRAAQLGACETVKGTHTHPGIFTADPAVDPEAEHIPEISYSEMIQRGLRVMDMTSITLAMDNDPPMSVRIFHQNGADSIYQALAGDSIGSLITA